ncbi:uncharacterized protein LOC144112588 [Amblyomma americanum]
MIAMYVEPDRRNRNAALPFVTFVYNSALQRTTGYSPFFLVFGRSHTTLLDACFFSAPASSSPSLHEQCLSRVARGRHLARLNTEACNEDRKSHYDTTHHVVLFNPGDEVLLSTRLRTPGLCDKFQPRFIGPSLVLTQTSPVNYRVTPVDPPPDRRYRGTEIVHVYRLKPFIRRSASD